MHGAGYSIENYRRQARRLGVPLQPEDVFTRQDVIRLYGDRCWYCRDGTFSTLDHYVPISKGGAHTRANVRPACVRCNIQKKDQMPPWTPPRRVKRYRRPAVLE